MRGTMLDLKSTSVYTVYTKKKGEKTMAIKERKFREVGNSVVLTISKEFLKENGLNPGDTVFLDEEKLLESLSINEYSLPRSQRYYKNECNPNKKILS